MKMPPPQCFTKLLLMNEKAAAALLAISVQLWVKSWAREPEAQDGFGKGDGVAF
jgi:hypothetical protein